MKTFVKCELCDVEVSDDRCIFAQIDGEDHCFCCQRHADEYKCK